MFAVGALFLTTRPDHVSNSAPLPNQEVVLILPACGSYTLVNPWLLQADSIKLKVTRTRNDCLVETY
jgi:hypothetical protein